LSHYHLLSISGDKQALFLLIFLLGLHNKPFKGPALLSEGFEFIKLTGGGPFLRDDLENNIRVLSPMPNGYAFFIPRS